MYINHTIESRKAPVLQHTLIEIVNKHSNRVSFDEIKNAQFLEQYVPFEEDLIQETVDFKLRNYLSKANGHKIGIIYSEKHGAIEFYKI
jgi:hypothetical protein